MDQVQIETIMSQLKAGEQVDLCLSGNGVRSSKDCIGYPQPDGTVQIGVWHSISDAWSLFTEAAFREVLAGTRSFWDGDIEDDDEEPERDENGGIIS